MRQANNNESVTPPTELEWANLTFERNAADYDIKSYAEDDSNASEEIFCANQIQGQDYVRSGYIDQTKLDTDGKIVDLKDQGSNVTYIIAHRKDADATIDGSLKVIQNSELTMLPAYEYAGDMLKPAFRNLIERHHQNDSVRGVVEIGGLSRAKDVQSSFVSYELIREIMQRAVRANTNEIWLITFTEKAFRPIYAAFGPRVITIAGDNVEIAEQNEHVRLIPSVIEPMSLLDNLALSIQDEEDPQKRTIMTTTLLLMADGLEPHEISSDVHRIITAETEGISA